MLVTASLNDSQVMYWEPAKYVARLRTLKTDDNPLLLKTNMGGGHGGASGRYDRLRERGLSLCLAAEPGGNREIERCASASPLVAAMRLCYDCQPASAVPARVCANALRTPRTPSGVDRFADHSIPSSHAAPRLEAAEAGRPGAARDRARDVRADVRGQRRRPGRQPGRSALPAVRHQPAIRSRGQGPGVRVPQPRAHQPQGQRRGRRGLPEPARLVRRREALRARRAQRLRSGRPGS